MGSTHNARGKKHADPGCMGGQYIFKKNGLTKNLRNIKMFHEQAAVAQATRLLHEVAKCRIFYLAPLLRGWSHFTADYGLSPHQTLPHF